MGVASVDGSLQVFADSTGMINLTEMANLTEMTNLTVITRK